MAHILTNVGEEWMVKHNLDAEAPAVGLYDDSTDAVGDGDTTAPASEPTDGSYAQQTGIAVSADNPGGDWGIVNDNSITFQVDGTTGTVDSYFFVVNFDSTEAGGVGDHLVVTGGLSQSYDLSNLDTLEISAGTAGVTVN